MRTVRNVYELWAHGTSYASLHAMNQTPEARAKWEPYRSTPFKIQVSAIHHSFPSARAKEVFDGFGYMNYERFVMDNPELWLLCCEECPCYHSALHRKTLIFVRWSRSLQTGGTHQVRR
jgi:tRNA (guanine10-N2)-methyltransferase